VEIYESEEELMCDFCKGIKPIFLNDENNHAFIKSNGVMTVAINCQEVSFQVDRCPMCGRLFKGVNYLNLRKGDDIWYADKDENCVEHGIIHSVCIKNGRVDSFSVDFDCDDFDEFDGKGLGVYFFMHKIDAEEALAHADEKSVSTQPAELAIGTHIWYIDTESNEMKTEHCIVQYVMLDNGHVDWFSAKFDNGDIEEFGPCALGIYCFKSKASAELAWQSTHGTG
jgi:hypothetical protein